MDNKYFMNQKIEVNMKSLTLL